MQIKSFDRNNLKDIRIALDNALDLVAKQYGVKFHVAAMRFDQNHFTAKMTANIVDPTAPAITIYGVDLPKIGDVRYNKSSKYTVTAINPQLPKFKIFVTTQNGAKYKVSLDQWNSFQIN